MNANAKSYIRTLTNAKGTERLQVLAIASKEGFSFYILHQKVDGKKVLTVARGAARKIATLAESVTAVDEAVESAKSKGWVKSAGPRGFVAKPDAFGLDSLPAAVAPVEKPEEAPEEAPVEKKPKK